MTMTHRTAPADEYYAGLQPLDVAPLWASLGSLLPSEPVSAAVPHLWRYADVRPALLEAGDVVSAEEAERRVLMLMNPGLDGAAAATGTLYAGLQLVLPGEIAGAHFHSQCALRFIVEGGGGYTTVAGERAIMHPGDMIITPSGAIHDHGNEGDGPMIWLDGLDMPIVKFFEARFFTDLGHEAQPLSRPIDATSQTLASARLNPPSARDWSRPYSPLIHYPWIQTEAALRGALEAGETTPTDGVVLEYVNPYTGGPVMPTLGCAIQLLPAGTRTAAHRHTSSQVFHVARGSGTTVIDGAPIAWEERDTFALPAWAPHHHVVDGPDEAILFSFTDEPAVRALGLYVERAEPEED